MKKPKLHTPQALGFSKAKRVRPGRTFTHLRVWRATHLKIKKLALDEGIEISSWVAKVVDEIYSERRGK